MSIRKGVYYVFIANVINLALSLFTSLFLPRILSISSYSYIKLFQLYIAYVGILHLGFSDGMYLRLGGKSKNKLNKEEIIAEFNTFKLFQVIIVCILLIISIIIKNKMMFLCSLAVLPINIGNYVRNLYQATGEFKKYSKYTNISTLLMFFVNVFLLFIIKSDNAMYYIIGYLLSYIIYWMFIEYEVKKEFGFNYNLSFKSLINDIKDGFFLMIGNFCNVIFTGIDRIFVDRLLGSVKFAYYSFAVSIENLLSVFITPISTVMYNYFCVDKSISSIKKIKNYLIVLSSYLIASVFVIKYIVNHYIEKYNPSIDCLFILFAATYVSIIVRCIHVNLYKSFKKQNKYFIIMVLMIFISIITNLLAYKLYASNYAIAVATLLTNIIWFITGELEFKEYRLDSKKYLYMVITILAFIGCNLIRPIILAVFIYIVLISIFTFILMNKELKDFEKEINGFIERRCNHGKKNI